MSVFNNKTLHIRIININIMEDSFHTSVFQLPKHQLHGVIQQFTIYFPIGL